MKKMLICCGVLCMTLLLFCGTALAAVKVDTTDTSVKVETTDDKVFTVTKSSGVTSGQLYLVMIQKGSASDKPTVENLYYLNVEKADSDSSFTMKAYPKDLTDGSYVVCLSDASGVPKEVATLTVGDIGGDILYGDVNGDGKVNATDRAILARYLAHWPDYGPDKTATNRKVIEANSDLNADSKVNASDRAILARHLANWPDYQTLPRVKSS